MYCSQRLSRTKQSREKHVALTLGMGHGCKSKPSLPQRPGSGSFVKCSATGLSTTPASSQSRTPNLAWGFIESLVRVLCRWSRFRFLRTLEQTGGQPEHYCVIWSCNELQGPWFHLVTGFRFESEDASSR